MKKLKTSWWGKLLASILWIIAVIGSGISILNVIYTYGTNADEEIRNGERIIAGNLAARVLNEVNTNSLRMEGSQNQALERLEENFDFAIISSTSYWLSDVDLSDSSVYLYKSADFDKENYAFSFAGSNNATYEWNDCASVITMSSMEARFCNEEDYVIEAIEGYVLDSRTGILYIRTQEGDYPVKGLTVQRMNGEIETASYRLSEDNQYVSQTGNVLKWAENNIVLTVPPEIRETKDEYGYSDSEIYESYYEEYESGDLYWGKETTNNPESGCTVISEGKDIHPVKNIGNYFITEKGITKDQEFHYQGSDGHIGYWVLMTPKNQGSGTLVDDLETMLFKVFRLKTAYPFLVILGFIIFVASSAFLICAAGHRSGKEEICLCWLDRVPFGILTVLAWLPGTLCVGGIYAVFAEANELHYTVLIKLAMFGTTVLLLIFLLYVLSIAARLKAHKFMRYTLLYYIWIPVRKLLGWMGRVSRKIYQTVRKNTSLVVKSVLAMIIMGIIEVTSILFVYEFYYYELGPMLLLMIVLWAAQTGIVVLIVLQLSRLQKGSARIAAGNLDRPIDTNGLFWEFKKHGENINKIGDGIQLAVQEQMKSEHFKTELITNVSHDIKTPLTSIINYVDLMKKEQITDPTLLSYMEVLDRQSARLKKLIEDLMEASKASTGSLEVNLEPCDVCVLLTQMIGEFEERAAAASLQYIVSNPDSAVTIMADGRHLWRVFDNLLGNVCKYAMPGTRVYVSLHIENNSSDCAVITFKNISKSQLNISSEELMERFVRGDSSRNTEGSGLGLSIAQSLTELMNGTMVLEVDGDLFKVILRFPVV